MVLRLPGGGKPGCFWRRYAAINIWRLRPAGCSRIIKSRPLVVLSISAKKGDGNRYPTLAGSRDRLSSGLCCVKDQPFPDGRPRN